ncbi:hypothetical protein E2562_011752 [Oryza meyeriana var. granulata]|uniref:Uncharacterized protein n=1 Tax=Oryza meyeriana var. granulata TaxID=110450 RepID=A0A6G1CP18_9ORYZ|nr:hypothetical protein E2562_011752 [Oryza meyeriana var. granulata]
MVAAAIADGERALERQRQKERKEAEHKAWKEACAAALAKIHEYDPKHGGCLTYMRFFMSADPATFDLDEESPISPMRCTANEYNIHITNTLLISIQVYNHITILDLITRLLTPVTDRK